MTFRKLAYQLVKLNCNQVDECNPIKWYEINGCDVCPQVIVSSMWSVVVVVRGGWPLLPLPVIVAGWGCSFPSSSNSSWVFSREHTTRAVGRATRSHDDDAHGDGSQRVLSEWALGSVRRDAAVPRNPHRPRKRPTPTPGQTTPPPPKTMPHAC